MQTKICLMNFMEKLMEISWKEPKQDLNASVNRIICSFFFLELSDINKIYIFFLIGDNPFFNLHTLPRFSIQYIHLIIPSRIVK